jgi:hypothetical protein
MNSKEALVDNTATTKEALVVHPRNMNSKISERFTMKSPEN